MSSHPQGNTAASSSSETLADTRPASTFRPVVSHHDPSPDGADIVNLPTRTLAHDAALEEYTQETATGQIIREVRSNRTGNIERYELVTWKVDDPENPKNWPKAYKW